MDNVTMDELHKLQLEIAKEIKRVCELNNIEYFLIGGTLLGAVRHGGFIPWDDDMDIGMTYENYNKFIEVAPNCLDKRFGLHTYENDEKYGYLFAKLRLKYTHMREAILEETDIDNGIFVDIFPYDLSTEKEAQGNSTHMFKMRLLGKILMIKSGYKLNDITDSVKGKVINTLINVLPISRETCWKRILRELKSCKDDGDKKYYIERDGMFKGNFVFPINTIDKQKNIYFEGISFNAPEEYDTYLKQAYGDYMKLPPEETRKIGHSVLGVVLDKPFEWYFKEMQ